MALSALIYDRQCRGPGPTRWLGRSFVVGAALHGLSRRFDVVIPARDWPTALADLLARTEGRTLDEIQFWGHGKWGEALIGQDRLDARTIATGGALHDPFCTLAPRLAGPDATLWFRTCETFGAHRGQTFARAISDLLGCSVAGHTHIIGPWQSGLHRLRPGQRPAWSPDSGLRKGSAEAPQQARWSRPGLPRSVSCLRRALPSWA